MFHLWLNTNPNATRKIVIETLRKDAIGESVVAEEYVKALKKVSYRYYISKHHLLNLSTYLITCTKGCNTYFVCVCVSICLLRKYDTIT